MPRSADALRLFHPLVQRWFREALGVPTAAQRAGWAAIAGGASTLIQAPTGSGKTLAAFLWAINRLLVEPPPPPSARCRVVYVSPLKALAVDIERNLRLPLDGIFDAATREGVACLKPTAWVRTGDTPQAERARFKRKPADILITTPESLFLMLTSDAREALRSVHTVIVDEVHALVPTKRGAHLALSLERLEALTSQPLQRIGLSATQRPLEEVARYLGGAAPEQLVRKEARRRARTRVERPAEAAGEADAERALHDEFQATAPAPRFRPVTPVATGERKRLELRVEVPVEDLARLEQVPPGPRASTNPAPRQSIWTAIHPRLLALVRQHRSTLLFVNSRRVAERLAGALNELAGEQLVRAHHGSIAREQRVEIEEALKAGTVRGLVATSSLELGIDMGAIDLVIQIESPPSVASGLQRAGRGGHQIHATSRAIIVPKYRGDLVACAAVTRAMHDGQVESTRYPRNPLDVLAQQLVAIVAMDRWHVDDLYRLACRAAPFAELNRTSFDGVLDMLSGRYPSDAFAELRPRVTWDRATGLVTAREGAMRVAVVNAGTIPDRGLYGVFLSGGDRGAARVGELDEEMVFESRVGETFVLGASTWRIDEITHDRVTVSPAPGELGKMPFWKAEAPGRPLEFGLRVGHLVRTIRGLPPAAAIARLVDQHDLDRQAAENLLRYLEDQVAATGAVPDDRTLVVERMRDEVGSWRLCVLSPLGGRVHAPWAVAAAARIRDCAGVDVETMWTDDGFVVRFPETDAPPDVSWLLPPSADVEHLVIAQLGSTAFFAARFREAAGRALLLPRRRPGARSPLWQQRKRASDLLAVASQYGSFPIVLEAYRECLRDDFDVPALVEVMRRIERRAVRVVTVDSTTPSPFAASLLFGYVANYLYDGDAPLAERRAQALTIDQSQLRALVGTADLRELLDADALTELEDELQGLGARRRPRSADGVHDLLLTLGDCSREELAARVDGDADGLAAELLRARRIVDVAIAGTHRFIPIEYASQFRDALGIDLPARVPRTWLAAVDRPLEEFVLRFARTHGPFVSADLASRYGLATGAVDEAAHRLLAGDRLLQGAFRPGGVGDEWCAPDVLRLAQRRSLARLRREVAPVAPAVLGRLLTTWQGVGSGRTGLDALLDAIQSIQGAAFPASLLESHILPARVAEFEPDQLDTLAAAGEIAWVGIDPLGMRDGRMALYLTDAMPTLLPPRPPAAPGAGGGEPRLEPREEAVLDTLRTRGASFFGPLHDAVGGGYPGDALDALWQLVWRGLVTNDAFHALRAYLRPAEPRRQPGSHGAAYRSRRQAPPAAAGRWSAVPVRMPLGAADTAWAAAYVDQLFARYGVLTRDVASGESIPGGFSALYPILRALEDAGRIRRGYFVAGVAATQFALPPALDLLRSLRDAPETPNAVRLASTDPASPYGTLLKWPDQAVNEGGTPPVFARAAGTSVVLVDGALAAFLRTGRPDLTVMLPDSEPGRSRVGRALAAILAALGLTGEGRTGGLLISQINGVPAAAHPFAADLTAAGFIAGARGFALPRR